MIALPAFFCPKLWEDMTGGETERFCSKCQKTVHNIESFTLDQRLALLSAPKGSICGRYRMGVRRARPGYEQSYMQHLLKYGAGVAASSVAFITLWQLYDESHRELIQPTFRVVAPSAATGCGMSEEIYDEQTIFTLGMIALSPRPPNVVQALDESRIPVDHVDIRLEPVEWEKLIQSADRPRLNFPQLTPSKDP